MPFALEVMNQEIQKSDFGHFSVSGDTIFRLAMERYFSIEEELQQLVRDNPEFEFVTENNVINGGITISWRRISKITS